MRIEYWDLKNKFGEALLRLKPIAIDSSFFKLIEENIDFRITMSLTPPILSMLDNTLLKQRYIIYLKEKIKLSALEIERTKDIKEINKLSIHYYEK